MRSFRRHLFLLVVLVLSLFALPSLAGTLDECRAEGACQLEVYVFPRETFAFREGGRLVGFDVDLIERLIQEIEAVEGLDIAIHWNEIQNFQRLYRGIVEAEDGTMGIAQISIRDDRRATLDLSRPYMSSVAVLATGPDLEPITDWEAAQVQLAGRRCLTIPGTTLDKATQALAERIPGLASLNVDSDTVLLQRMEAGGPLLAYFDLPQFLQGLEKGVPLVRHPFADLPGDRFGVGLPKDSSWTGTVDRSLEKLVGSPDYVEILTRWFGDEAVDDLAAP